MEEFFENHESTFELPVRKEHETIFEFLVNETGEWKHWHTRVKNYEYPKDSIPEYASILVPNTDNTRTDFLLETIMKQVLFQMLLSSTYANIVIIGKRCSTNR